MRPSTYPATAECALAIDRTHNLALTLWSATCRSEHVRLLNFAAMHRSLLMLFALLCALPEADAQRLMSRKRPDIIPLDGKAKRIGWYVAPGITYTLPRFKNSEEELYRNADTSYTATYDPNGRIGIYAEAGLAWFTRDPVIVDYFDLGLAYKNLRGSESYESTLVRGDSSATFTGDGTFAERFLTLHFTPRELKTRTEPAQTWAFPVHGDHPLWVAFDRAETKRITRADCEEYAELIEWNCLPGGRTPRPDILSAILRLADRQSPAISAGLGSVAP